jgi:hypothetical protein
MMPVTPPSFLGCCLSVTSDSTLTRASIKGHAFQCHLVESSQTRRLHPDVLYYLLYSNQMVDHLLVLEYAEWSSIAYSFVDGSVLRLTANGEQQFTLILSQTRTQYFVVYILRIYEWDYLYCSERSDEGGWVRQPFLILSKHHTLHFDADFVPNVKDAILKGIK